MKKVITYGTFDLFHHGHANLLRRAKELGDYLIVGVTSENYDKYRGKLNVAQSVIDRIDNVKKSGFADEIIVEEYEGQKIDDIVKNAVDIFAIGSDWLGRFDYLKEFCDVVYLERTKGISRTDIRSERHPLIHFGVIGAGRIANRFIPESKFVSGVTVDGVFCINDLSAKDFATKHELLFSTSKYEHLLDNVNAVYIASPHHTHYDYAKKALMAGKHVLCEKPMTLSKVETEELYKLANKKGLILLEAIKTAFCPGFLRMISCAKSGKIGNIVSVEASFTKLVSEHSREMNFNNFGGSVTELSTYPLLAIYKILGDKFRDVNFISYRNDENSVDLFTKINLIYEKAIATAAVGIGVKSEGDLKIMGTRGYVYVPAPWWKTDYFELRYENQSENDKEFYKFLGDGLRYEIVDFVKQISDNKNDINKGFSIFASSIIEAYLLGKSKIEL